MGIRKPSVDCCMRLPPFPVDYYAINNWLIVVLLECCGGCNDHDNQPERRYFCIVVLRRGFVEELSAVLRFLRVAALTLMPGAVAAELVGS